MATVIFGTGGVGPALGRRLVAKGRKVHIIGRNENALNSLKSELKCGTSQVDMLADDASIHIEKALKEAEEHSNGIEGLCYAIGSIPLKMLKQTTPKDHIQAYKLNVIGAAEAIRLAFPSLVKTKGGVVLFSSVAVRQGFPSHSVIAAAKGAIEGLTVSLGAEFSSQGVRVNCVAPSLITSPLGSQFTKNEGMAQSLAAAHPLGRLGTPEDIAAAAEFLLSHEAEWITGQIWGVDGGRSALRPKL